MTGPITGNPNTLDDRAAMGLPGHFVERAFVGDTTPAHGLVGCTPEELVAVAEGRDEPQGRRLAAGALLALLGDPRVRPLDPPMVFAPPARARIGLPPEDVDEVVARWRHVGVKRDWIVKECPEHDVDLAGFAIGQYPVTNFEYRCFLLDLGADADPQWLPTSWTFGVYPPHLANHPVWTCPPEAADAYTAWLSAAVGRRFRLPTEAEWEYVARGENGREFPWGDHVGPDHANTVEYGPLTTTPIGCYPRGASPLGVLDLAGNVEEYVADAYRAYPGGDVVADDLQRQQGSYRVARGGSFTRFADLARCRRRHGRYDKPIYAMGFRLAETLPQMSGGAQ